MFFLVFHDADVMVISVWAEHPKGQVRPTGEGGPHRKWIKLLDEYWDKRIWDYYGKFRKYYKFNKDVCGIAEKVDTLRLELNTRDIDDWTEVDYMYMYGSDRLPEGALPYNEKR